jgi:hypothetical protein
MTKKILIKIGWWAGPDSNRRPSARQADVLTRLDDRPLTAILGCVFSYLSFSLPLCPKCKADMRKWLILFLPITLNSSPAGFRMSWAGRSAWNDRSVGIAEAAGSNPVPSTTKTVRTSCWVFSSIQTQISGLRRRLFLPPPRPPQQRVSD